MKNYYKVLGLAETASEQEIKSAYRKLAFRFHSDRNPGDAEAAENYLQVGQAYEMLGSPEKRAAYDKERKTVGASRAARSGGPFGGTNQPQSAPGTTANPFRTGNIKLDDIFETFIPGVSRPSGGGRSAAAGAARPSGTAPAAGGAAAGEPRLEITLEEAFHGAQRAYPIRGDAPCPDCRGTGNSQAGRGGLQVGTMCLGCQGAGRKPQAEEVTVTIPRGAYDGLPLRVRGKGALDKQGSRGDLILTVRLKKHPLFERAGNGNDLSVDVAVPYTVLVLGGEVETPTLDGKKPLTVPPGTPSGKVLRLPGLGLPALRDRPAGDLNARVKVAIPSSAGAEERRLLLELARLRGDPVRA